VESAAGGRPAPAGPAQELRAAFAQYADFAGLPWKPKIRALPAGSAGALADAAARVDLTAADARVLAGLLRDAAGQGPGPGGPAESWIGSDDVAARIGVEASTIRGWVARGGPKAHPFPPPQRRYRGRNFWQKASVDQWQAEQRRLDAQHRANARRLRASQVTARPARGASGR